VVCKWKGGACECESSGSSSMLRLIRRDLTLVRMFPTFNLNWTLGVETCESF
jgi:hypothetical protein